MTGWDCIPRRRPPILVIKRASALPNALLVEMTASALLLAPGACTGRHGRGRRKNNVGYLARMRDHYCVASAGH